MEQPRFIRLFGERRVAGVTFSCDEGESTGSETTEAAPTSDHRFLYTCNLALSQNGDSISLGRVDSKQELSIIMPLYGKIVTSLNEMATMYCCLSSRSMLSWMIDRIHRICRNLGIGDAMAKDRSKKKIGKASKTALPRSVGKIKIVSVEPLKLSERESRLLGELSDWQRQSARSDYMCTDQSSCG